MARSGLTFSQRTCHRQKFFQMMNRRQCYSNLQSNPTTSWSEICGTRSAFNIIRRRRASGQESIRNFSVLSPPTTQFRISDQFNLT
jgi:hypothetical protein